MDYRTRMEYFKAIYQRYRTSSKNGKTKILDEFCRTTGLNRKYAIWKLNGPLEPPAHRPPQRGYCYGDDALKIALDVWKHAGYPWSNRLKTILRDWLPWIQKRYRPRPKVERQLLAISARQLDRRLRRYKTKINRRIYGRTKPGRMLKHHIPIRTANWDVKGPGWVEVDLVAHSGSNATGEFAYALNLTDIYTGWVETRAVMGKGFDGILAALEEMRQALPFRLRGLDSDNGSEFINHHLCRYCRANGITFTRGRPYAKEDNAHIEQKNWTHVRRLMGYDRYDTWAAVRAMNEFYRREGGVMMNLFQPSVKLTRKERVGSRLRRKHDSPRTPLERLKSSPEADCVQLAKLMRLKTEANPFALSEAIDAHLSRIHGLANQRIWPRKPFAQRKGPERQRPRAAWLARSGFKRRDNTISRLDSLMA